MIFSPPGSLVLQDSLCISFSSITYLGGIDEDKNVILDWLLQTTIIGSTYLHAINGELSELKGSISLVLEAGTPEKPFFG